MGRADVRDQSVAGRGLRRLRTVGASSMVEVQVFGQLDQLHRHDDVLSCIITCDGLLGAFALPTRLVLHDGLASCMSRIGVAERRGARRATTKKEPLHMNGTAWRSCGREPGGENRRTVRGVCEGDVMIRPWPEPISTCHTLLPRLSMRSWTVTHE